MALNEWDEILNRAYSYIEEGHQNLNIFDVGFYKIQCKKIMLLK